MKSEKTSDIQWKLKPYKEGNENSILELAKKVFYEQPNDRFSEIYWRWEFIKNPDGNAIIWVAEDNGKIVGHYAVIPRLLNINDESHNGSIVVDVMTDPDYRFQGMFTKLGKISLNDAGDKDIEFSYGFPVRKDVMPGHLKIGWKHTFDIPIYVYPINFMSITGYYIKNDIVNKFVSRLSKFGFNFVAKPISKLLSSAIAEKINVFLIKEIDYFTLDFDDLWQESKSYYNIACLRTSKHLNWRYINHPYYKYNTLGAYFKNKLVGYIVFKQGNIFGFNMGLIVDLFVHPDYKDCCDILIQNVINIFKQNYDIDLIACMSTKYSVLTNYLKRNGFFKSSKVFWFIIHPNQSKSLSDTLINEKNWHLTWGDTDVV
ncbi:GNAT family N-acetyltransferase [Patescibacteria group bacterium]|nr:GNAT family N-acetyltransferase [Patescibacteria group bacterium]